ncbi:MAG: sel1 repeat family protein [Magnetococcales bacterium]|nr:sel1 repeat family protein [Magnetococcales bacterium]
MIQNFLSMLRNTCVTSSVVFFLLAFSVNAQEDDFEQCRMAAERGDFKAQFRLGMMYANGQGVQKDDKEAVKWLFSSAYHQGDADAQVMLGYMHEYGRGVPQSYKEAALWYAKAANQQHQKAQEELGRDEIRSSHMGNFYVDKKTILSLLEKEKIKNEELLEKRKAIRKRLREWVNMSEEERKRRELQLKEDRARQERHREQREREEEQRKKDDKQRKEIMEEVIDVVRRYSVITCNKISECERTFSNVKGFIADNSDMKIEMNDKVIVHTHNTVNDGNIGMKSKLLQHKDGSAEINLEIYCKGFDSREVYLMQICRDKIVERYRKFRESVDR